MAWTVRAFRSISIVLLLIALGLGSGLGYSVYTLDKERKANEQLVKGLEKKLANEQQKVKESKSRISNLEGQNRAVQNQLAKAQEEKSAVEEEVKGLQGKLVAAETSLKELADAQTSLKAGCAALEKQYTEAAKAQVEEIASQFKKRYEAAVEQMNEQKGVLEASLKGTKESLDQCRSNNQSLGAISKELLQKYENKGFFQRAVENEPLTQFKKIELEKLVQEYSHKIDDQMVKAEKSK